MLMLMEKFKQRNKATIKEERNWSSLYTWLLDNNNKEGYQMVIFIGYHGVYRRQDREGDNPLTIIVKDVFNVSDSLLV